MIIFTGGNYIKTSKEATPIWSDCHKRYYVYGYRWIKTRQTFSTQSLLHNFVHYEPIAMTYQEFMNEHGKYPIKV